MKVLALDLSLTCIGVADNYGGEPVCYTIHPPAKLRGVPRLLWIRESVLGAACVGHRADLVLIEGYSFNSRTTRAHATGELGGVIRVGLHDAGVPWTALAPKTVKKLATGAGNAKKEAVLVSAVTRLGYKGSSTDEADALWLLAAALIHYGLPGAASLPKTHLEALKKVEWPEIPAMEAVS